MKVHSVDRYKYGVVEGKQLKNNKIQIDTSKVMTY